MSDRASLLRMPKLMITGYIEGQYEDTYTKSGDFSNHSYRFSELLNLNARGFIVDRRLLIYNVGLDLEESQGNGPGSKYDYFAVKLDMLFLPFRPFSVGVRASYADAQGGLVSKGAGLSVVYTRSAYVPSAAQQLQRQKQQQQQGQGQSQGIKLQQNADKDEEEADQNHKQNAVKEPARPSGPGFLFSILPKIYNLDFDVYNNKSSTEDTTYYNTRFYMKGDYGKTDYFVNVADFYIKDNYSRTSTNQFFSDISSVTKWSQAVLNTKAYYGTTSGTGTESSTSYGLLADTSGRFLKTWDYRINANYQVTDDRERTTTYQTVADVGSSSTVGRTTFGYRFGVGYNRTETSESSDNASASASLGTETRLTSSYSVSTFSGISAGTELSLYSFRILNNYRPSSRVHVYLGYAIRDTIAHKEDTNVEEGPVHTLEAGVNYYHVINLSSGIIVSISPKTEAENWNTIASTTIRRINIVFGANLRREKPRGEITEINGTETRSYDVYNIISGPFFFRNSGFSFRTGYSRTRTKSLLEGASRTAEIFSVNPLIRWFWRRLIIEADGTYIITNQSDGSRVIDRRIMLRVRRPFRLL